ncbi:SRPBCC family protein [Corynebacterium sputi]|uniref:SRPBCC family protein n=1 Tax=Corynebacterium sputi TaxID=489915 RepID=UPI00040D07B3|nr:SRPBCC family protein [Corynebacterium sputi]
MKYVNAVEIDKPYDEVARLLADPDIRPRWLRGLVSHEPLNGADGHVGTRSRIVFRAGKQEMECTETITRRSPVDLDSIGQATTVYFEREITAKGMSSNTRDKISHMADGRTCWESTEEYRFTGVMRFLAPLMRGAFARQSLLHMNDFKAFAENGTDVREH